MISTPRLREIVLCIIAACACCMFLSGYFGDVWRAMSGLLCCALLFLSAVMLRPSKREKIACLLPGGAFGVMYTVGYSYDNLNSYGLLMKNGRTFSGALMCMLALALVAACVCLLAIRLMNRLRDVVRRKGEADAQERKRLFVLSAALIFMGSIPYLLLYAPGLNIYDTHDQLLQFFGFPSYIGDGSALSDHHPVFLTLVYGGFIKLGLALGDPNIGQLLYSLASMAVLALCWAYVLCTLYDLGLSPKAVLTAALFVALYPVLALYAFNMCKDVSIEPFVLLYIAQSLRLHQTDGAILRKRGFALSLFAVCMLLMLTRKPSMYALLFAAIFFIIRFKGVRLRLAAVLLGSIALFQFGYNGVLLPATGVIEGETKEMLSIPFQQTARYLITHPDDVTSEEMDVLTQVLDVEHSKAHYNPRLSDPVKDTSNPQLGDSLAAYVRVWISMGLRHPGVYLDAWLNMIYGYFYPSQSNTIVCLTLTSPDAGDIVLSQNEKLADTRLALYNFIYFTLRKTPGLGMLFYVSTVTWVFLFLLVYLVMRGGLRAAAPWMFFVGTLGICMLSPKSGEIRYMLPILYGLIPMLGTALLPDSVQKGAHCP